VTLELPSWDKLSAIRLVEIGKPRDD
jgi:hypothetical protein